MYRNFKYVQLMTNIPDTCVTFAAAVAVAIAVAIVVFSLEMCPTNPAPNELSMSHAFSKYYSVNVPNEQTHYHFFLSVSLQLCTCLRAYARAPFSQSMRTFW